MKLKLDKTDYRILKILQQDGRITNLQLSKEVGLSTAPTLMRVQKLEEAKIIKGYYAELNEELLGFSIKAIIQVSLTRQRENTMQDFSKKINQIDEIVECNQITGTYDYQLKAVVKDIAALNDLISEKLSKVKGIRKIQSYIILSSVKSSKLTPLNYGEPLESAQ